MNDYYTMVSMMVELIVLLCFDPEVNSVKSSMVEQYEIVQVASPNDNEECFYTKVYETITLAP